MNHQVNLDGHAQAVDDFIRAQIIIRGSQNRNASFPMELWNVTDSLELGLSRTNNSIESFFHIWNGELTPNPRLSKFVHRVLREDTRWRTVVEDYQLNPADGIRGGLTRKRKWLRQDQTLTLYLNNFYNTDPLTYLRRVAYKISKKL